MKAAQVAHALKGRKSGTGYAAKCPAHNDRNPSLSITDGNDGRLLVHCHSGCEQAAVVDALRNLGLWPEPTNQSSSVERRITATYNYTDEAGNLMYQICRLEPKDFLQRYPDGAGGWIWRKHPNQVLYHLPEVLENPIIFLVEGEKDVETLREYGFVATTNAGGTNAPWLPQFTAALRAREVNIIPDNDKPGWMRATTIARALLGTAAQIRVLDLPRDIKDVSEWFAAGHSECELIAMLEGVHAA